MSVYSLHHDCCNCNLLVDAPPTFRVGSSMSVIDVVGLPDSSSTQTSTSGVKIPSAAWTGITVNWKNVTALQGMGGREKGRVKHHAYVFMSAMEFLKRFHCQIF